MTPETLFPDPERFSLVNLAPYSSDISLPSSPPQIPLELNIHEENTITGWDYTYIILLLHSLLLTAVGIMFIVFSTGVVPIAWTLSTWGAYHLGLVNVLVTVFATMATAHTKFVIQNVVREFANVALVQGFTLNQLNCMQGVMEWSLTTKFPARKRALWLLLYLAIGLHSASVVSIMQPQAFVKNVHFPDTAPCGVQPGDLTLDPMNFLTDAQQALLDQSAYAVGLQLGTYYQAVQWNTTTTSFGRPYAKENISYGAVGGLHDGLQNVSGVLFDVQCATSADGQIALNSTWARTFPDRSFPLVTLVRFASQTSISGSFDDPPINTPSLQSIASSTVFNLTNVEMALYGLVNANGSGGVLGVFAENTVACTWLAIPKLVEVILVNWVARSYSVQDSATFPEYVGRGVVETIKGMAQASLLGARIDQDFGSQHKPSTSSYEMLEVMLADGVRMTLAGLTAIMADSEQSTVSMCHANVRTISVHWRFGNAHQLGWIAIIITFGGGISGVLAVWHFSSARRLKSGDALNLARIFMLAVDSDIPELPKDEVKEMVLRIQGNQIVVRTHSRYP